MKDSTIKTVCAIAGVVLLECVALIQGIDGIALGAAVAVLAGLGGYTLGKKETV